MANMNKEEWMEFARSLGIEEERLEHGWKRVLELRAEKAKKNGKLSLPMNSGELKPRSEDK